MESDASASDFSEKLSEFGNVHVDSISATRVIDEASWEFLLKRKRRSRSSRPPNPASGHLGEAVLQMLDNFAVCTVSCDPSAGKSRDVPPSLLSTLMERDRHGQYGIALYLDLKGAQNALYEHMQQEHPRIPPWKSI